MIEKFSVRKPYTVIVAVILVIILGVVSFTKMQTDLLPNMNLPYVLVMTTYGGASPEEVEETVTKTVEQSLASVSGLSNMTSQSSENLSLVTLEFEDDTNMDSVTLEIRESLDMITDSLPEEVGNPTIMKISMDMIPVLVTAIDSDQMEAGELSQYVESTLEPAVESVDGVASVSTSGLLEENINVIIDEEKIAKLNDKIQDAINGEFDEAEAKLEEAESKVEEAKNELSSQRASANAQLSKAKKALNDAQLSTTEKEIQVTSSKMTLESKIQEVKAQQKELEATVKNLNTQLKKLQEAGLGDSDEAKALKTQIAGYKKTITNLKSTVKSLNKQVSKLETALKQIQSGKKTINAKIQTLDEQSAEATSKLNSAEITIASNSSKIASQKEELETARDEALEAANMSKNITVDTVKSLLQAQNFEMPAGYITEDNVQYLVRVGDKVTSQKELEEMVLMDVGVDGIDPIRLKDVADVAVVNNAADTYCKVNGNDGIILSIQKQSTYSSAEVSDSISEKLEKLTSSKEGMHYTNLMDQGIYIDMIVESVLQNLIYGAILAMIILFLFLKDIRPTLVISLSIPISVVFALVLMYFTGITLNIISLSGLALGVGMLVDNSIVVIENIYRLRKNGMEVREAAVEGARGVGGAITASTLTTISVFLPIVFTTGLTKELFTDMALTIGFSLVASLIVAVTVVPMMASGILSKISSKDNRTVEKVKHVYEGMMEKVLSKRAVVLVVTMALFAGSIWGIAQKGFSLFPEMESTQMSMTLTMPEGSSQEEMADMANTVVAKVLEIKGVETIGSMESSGSTLLSMGSSGNQKTVTMYVMLKEDKELTNAQIQKQIEKKTKDFDCELDISSSTMDMGSIAGNGISVVIKGSDMDELRAISDQVADVITKTRGTTEVSNGQEETTEEVHIVVDKKKAVENGLTVAQVYQAISAELAEGTTATSVTQGEDTYDVVVEKNSSYAASREKLKNMKITATFAGEEKEVSLSQIAKIESSDSLSSIQRENQTRYINVTAEVKDGYNTTLLNNKIEKKLEKIELPNGYSLEMGGEAESVYEMMEQLGLMLVLAIVFMYLIMVAQFQSLLSPFIILFTIPLAFTGGLFALLIAGMDLSVIAMIGFVMLSGIIVNNGIVLVDTINQLREGGYEKNEAIITAGSMRIRPIFMTALTTILGLSTMCAGIGMGAEMTQPMAVVTVGGLIYGTLLTLIVIPCIYSLLNKEKEAGNPGRNFRFSKRKSGKWSQSWKETFKNLTIKKKQSSDEQKHSDCDQ
ncbi:MAG: efflux RND transporter permease subunit [Lachnospiraceae bacterium]|nr:efflux RND transporter permease subunit [Lachnospiraceae bacterium]